MSSIFDNAVYLMRKHAPFAAPQAMAFLKEKARESDYAVVLMVNYRPDVASRLWWELEWQQHGRRYQASAQEWDLCFWRAIQLHKQIERQQELESRPVTKGPGFFSAEALGWEGGDGI